MIAKSKAELLKKVKKKYPIRKGYERRIMIDKAPFLDLQNSPNEKGRAYYVLVDYLKGGKLKWHN